MAVGASTLLVVELLMFLGLGLEAYAKKLLHSEGDCFQNKTKILMLSFWCNLLQDRIKRRIQVSQDHGDTWNVAQLPSVTHEQFYSVLTANDNLIFIHVDDEGGKYIWL